MREKKLINIQIGEQVRIAREERSLTQERLAETLEVSPQYVSDLERGVVGISIPNLKHLCICLGVSSDQILFGTPSNHDMTILKEKCRHLTEKQYELLLEIIDRYVAAVNRAPSE